MLCDLARLQKDCIVFLQEVESWCCAPESCTHQVLHGVGGRAALAVPLNLSTSIRGVKHSLHGSGALVGQLGLCSAYLPNTSYSFAIYASALDEIVQICKYLRSAGARALIVGGDFNAQLYCNHSSVGELAWEPPEGRDEACARSFLLENCMETFGLYAANTFGSQVCKSDCFTQRPFENPNNNTQLDFVMASRSVTGRAGVFNKNRFRVSDHYPV